MITWVKPTRALSTVPSWCSSTSHGTRFFPHETIRAKGNGNIPPLDEDMLVVQVNEMGFTILLGVVALAHVETWEGSPEHWFNANFCSVILCVVSVLKGDTPIHDSRDKSRIWNILTSQKENNGLQLARRLKELQREISRARMNGA